MPTEISRRGALQGLFAVGAGVVAVGSASGLLSACGASSASGGTGPVKIGAITDLTGPFGIVGQSNKTVAQFAVNEINAAGGVLGRKLDLVVVDSASDPGTATTVAQNLVLQDKVSMVIGGVTAAEVDAFKATITGRGNTLFVWPGSYQGGECQPNLWSVGAVPNQQAEPVVDYLLEKGAKTFFLAGSDYNYPRTELAAARAKIEAGGGKVVDEQYIPISATDTSALVSKALAANADAIFDVVVLPAAPAFVKGLRQGGYKGMIGGTLFDQGVNALFGTAAQGLICAQDYYPGINDAFTTSTVAKFHQQFPQAYFASTLNSPGWYRGIHMWKAAVEAAGSFDLDKVNAAMAKGVSLTQSIGGPCALDGPTRHATLPMYLGEMQANGGVKVLKSLGQIKPQQC